MDSRTILLIEDDADDEALALRALRRNRVANPVTVLRDGAEALEYVCCTGRYAGRDPRDVPAVVLLDLRLPLVGGLEVLSRLRAEPGWTHVPVVVLTSSREEQDLVEAYRNRCNSYVRKPVDFAEFAEALRTLTLYWLLLNEAPREWGDPAAERAGS